MNKRASILLAGILCMAAPAVADEAAAGVAWDVLDREAQALLAGQQERWATLPPERQRAMAEGAQRWLAMDGIGRAQANERWQTGAHADSRSARAPAQGLGTIPRTHAGTAGSAAGCVSALPVAAVRAAQ